MLSPSELSSLYSIISDETKTFEAIAGSFQKTYSRTDQFKVGVTIWYLIKENLINLTQRLASFYILYDMYKQEQVPTTPFIPLLLQSLETSKNTSEKKLLADLIEITFVFSKMTIKNYIEETKALEDIKLPDLNQYWRMHNTTKEKGTSSINDWIRPIIYDKSNQDIQSPETMPLFDLTQLTPEEVSFNYFEPNYLTYYPNTNYPFYEDEPMWIIPTLKYDFIWDFTMSPEQDTISSLLNRILKNKVLTEEQNSYVLEVIGENPNILKEINFTPESMIQLIEKNEDLATEILCKIGRHNSFEK